MPLGFFGTSNSSTKPQPLTAEEVKKDKKDAERDCRGTVLKLTKTTITIEKKLAEGGFAIVYLVTDKQSRQYALKRQFINDDQKQVEACKREYQIVSSLRGHKNIVCYADHLLYQNKTGIYDYMLLTAYYKTSVLQWMNDRLAVGKGLSANEVLSIFCDMCEAVARLHHSQTPVIHRDLKVENILIDERNRAAPPIFVLCDFGSASTKVLSSNTHPVHIIKEEIDRYTTLSYRSPEMIDIYEGRPIGTKSDTWALGVMLFKLCYFSLPFGESALAIQNASFSFPTQPSFPDEIKAIIKCLLDPEIERRPSIYQCSSLAFAAAARPCPVNNVYNAPAPQLDHVVEKFKHGKHVHIGKAKIEETAKTDLDTPGKESITLISAESSGSTGRYSEAATTSVNPRLRPKPINSIPSVPIIPPSPKPLNKLEHTQPEQMVKSAGAVEVSSKENIRKDKEHKHFGFTDLEDALPRGRAQTEYFSRNNLPSTADVEPNDAPSTISLPSAVAAQSHRRHTSDTSHITRSAFKPYSQTVNVQQATSSNDVNEIPGIAPTNQVGASESSWNPFLAAPFGSQGAMDDNCFGEEFDGLRRTKKQGSNSNPDYDSDSVSIDSSDPFGAAPFDSSALRVLRSAILDDEDGAGSVGSSEDLRKRMQEEDSEVDEQRMRARRRYSYEHIDGVGDEGSSDSRGRTEGESTDEMSRKEESSHDEDNDSSQQTDVASDDGGGRPLLEDDGLEEDEEDSIHNYLPNSRFTQLIIDAKRSTNPFLNQDVTPKISPAANNHYNKSDQDKSDAFFETRHDSFIEKPFLPSMPPPVDSTFAPATLPRQVTPLSAAPRHPGIYNTRPLVDTAPPVPVHSAPAVGALIPVAPIPPAKPPTATQMKPVKKIVEKPPPPPLEPEVIIEPIPAAEIVSEPSFVEPRPRLKTTDTCLAAEPLEVMIKPRTGSMVEDRENVYKSSTYSSKSVAADFIEGPRTPRSKKVGREKKSYSRLDARSSNSECETDGSEAEMCSSISSDKVVVKQKRKKSTGFSLSRGSNVSVVPQAAITVATGGVKKNIEKRKMSSSKKTGSNDAVNASFVNNSFQSEDIDCPSHTRS